MSALERAAAALDRLEAVTPPPPVRLPDPRRCCVLDLHDRLIVREKFMVRSFAFDATDKPGRYALSGTASPEAEARELPRKRGGQEVSFRRLGETATLVVGKLRADFDASKGDRFWRSGR